VALLPAAHIRPRLVQQRGFGQHLPRDKLVEGEAAVVKADMVAVDRFHLNMVA
jgi:hypothetical protein